MEFGKAFHTYIKSGFPLIAVNSVETDRVTETLATLTQGFNKHLLTLKVPKEDEFLKKEGYSFWAWDIYNGWHIPGTSEKIEGTEGDYKNAFTHLLGDTARPGIYVMENFHLAWETDPYSKPALVQYLREVYALGRVSYKHLFMVGPTTDIPVEVRPITVSLDFALPTKDELAGFIKEHTEGLGVKVKKEELTQISAAAVGMTLHEVEAALCVSIVESNGKGIDKKTIQHEKAQAVKRSGLLEYIPTDLSMDSVGGLPYLKKYFQRVSKAFLNSDKAEKFGLDVPKGCLAVGISGTGKSLIAQAIAAEFGVPLLRSDVGRVFGGLVGETERKTRELFSLIETLAPCVVLIDEIEKALAGLGSSSNSDAGVTARFIGNFLYWMQEKKVPAYVVATANDVGGLPPELLRKGRFDDMWFVDLPSLKEREDIFRIHLNKRGRDVKKFNLSSLAKATPDFTGAEVESVVKEGLFHAFAEDREVEMADLLMAAEDTIPLIKTKPKEVEALRQWARDKAKPANGYNSSVRSGVKSKGKKHWALVNAEAAEA